MKDNSKTTKIHWQKSPFLSMYLCIMYFDKKPLDERVHMKGDAPFKGEGGGGEKKRGKKQGITENDKK